MRARSAAHRVVITGLGPITAIGQGIPEFWEAVLSGTVGIRALTSTWLDDKRFRTRIGAPVVEPDRSIANLTEREANLVDPAVRYALAASAIALRDAGLSISPDDAKRGRCRIEGVDPAMVGVIIGTGIGGLCTLEESHRLWVRREPFTGAKRYSLPMLIPNALPAQVAMKYGVNGECKAVVTACASGTMALGDAFRLVQRGELDLAIAGGADKTLSDADGYALLGFDLLRTMSARNEEPERASRPFDRERDGFVLGEGAGLLVLEREEHARARGARIYAEIAGYASTCDGHSMMQPEPSGDHLVRVMERSIRAAGLSPGDVSYVNAHGTSTRAGDAIEAHAIRRVFGRRVCDVLVNSTKAMLGHSIGAAGGIEAIVTALSLARGMVHRCVNLDRADPACDLSLPLRNHPIRGVAALSNSFGFGGHNSSLVLRAW